MSVESIFQEKVYRNSLETLDWQDMPAAAFGMCSCF